MIQEQKEQLSSVEHGPVATGRSAETADTLKVEQVEQLYQGRLTDLETLKGWVSLKFYYRVAEKIKQEQEAFKKLLRWENAKQDILSEYSFVLDSAYFEQTFL